MCRDGEIVLSGWSQSGTLSCGLQWEVEGFSDLLSGQCGESSYFFPTLLGYKAILLTHCVTSEGFCTSSKENDTGDDTALVRG